MRRAFVIAEKTKIANDVTVMTEDPQSNDQPTEEYSSDERHASKTAAEETNPNSQDDLSAQFREAIRKGSEDAKKTFDKVVPKAKEEFTQGVHDVAYAMAYAAAFGGALLREITPENIKDGFAEGSRAGARAAQEAVRQNKERRERAREAEAHDASDGEPNLA